MTEERRPPRSSAVPPRFTGPQNPTGSQHPTGPQNPTGVSEALAQVRVYKDTAALDRVWNRLDSQRRRSPVLAPAARVFVSGALVAAGVLLGITYERQRNDGQAMATAASSEVVTQTGPAGPVASGPQFAAPERDDKENARKSRVRRRVERLSSSVRPPDEVDSDSSEDLANRVEVEDAAAIQPKAEWVILVERGQYAASYQQLEESGGFDAVLSGGTSEELMTLVEVARFVGQQGRAIQALRAVTERHQSDPNAPIAAMILGNLLSKSGDAAGAARAYALNRRLSPGGDFAEDALVGEFDMALAAGDVARVERLRAKYEGEFPEGRHLESIRTQAQRLVERSSAFSRSPSIGSTSVGEEPSHVAAGPSEDETSEDETSEDEPSEDENADDEPSGEDVDAGPSADGPVEETAPSDRTAPSD